MISKTFYAAIALIFTLDSALAQRVQNPLYNLDTKTWCKANSAKSSISSNDRLLLELLKTYPIVPDKACLFGLSYRDLLKANLAPSNSSEHRPASCTVKEWKATPIDYAPSARFKQKSNALRFRRTLLRVMEASYSGGTQNFVVVRNLDEISKNITVNYRPLHNGADMDDIAIRRFIDGEQDFSIQCATDTLDNKIQVVDRRASTASPSITGGLVTTGTSSSAWIEPFQSGLKTLSKKHPYSDKANTKYATSGQLKIVRDATQFSVSKPKGLSIGTEFDREKDQDQSSVTIAGAAGFKWERKSPNIKNHKGETRTLSITPFVSIDQKPIDVAILDPKNPVFADGSINKSSKKVAGAELFGGARIDYEISPPECTIAKCRNGEGKGQRAPGDKFSFTVGGFTDNYADVQGMQYEAGYSPRIFSLLPGYRSESRLRGGNGRVNTEPGVALSFVNTFVPTTLEWDFTGIADVLDYGRAPKDNTTIDPSDRKVSPDSFRLGFDAELDLKWNNIFSIAGDDAGLKLGLDLALRQGYKENEQYARTFGADLTLTDILNDKYEFGVTFKEGEQLLTFEKFEVVGFNISATF